MRNTAGVHHFFIMSHQGIDRQLIVSTVVMRSMARVHYVFYTLHFNITGNSINLNSLTFFTTLPCLISGSYAPWRDPSTPQLPQKVLGKGRSGKVEQKDVNLHS